MDRSAYEIRKKQWQHIVSECINSSMNKTEWCRQNGISLRSVYYWQKKFRDEAILDQTSSSLPAVACEEKAVTSTDTDDKQERYTDLCVLQCSGPYPGNRDEGGRSCLGTGLVSARLLSVAAASTSGKG